jgi:signal peptidase I
MATASTATRITDGARWTPLVRVHGRSMHPSLRHGQSLLTLPRPRHLQVGDIVVLSTARGLLCVKRIAARAGDLVELEAGRLFVNGRPYDGQPRTKGALVRTWRVPEGHVFVVGDNLGHSDDSRVWEEPFVPASRIGGVAFSSLRRRISTHQVTVPCGTAATRGAESARHVPGAGP